MKYAHIRNFDITNGPGLRVSLFVTGCDVRCEGCFSSELWDGNVGKVFNDFTIGRIIVMCRNQHIDGLTILGGEPLEEKSEKTMWLIKLCNYFNKYFKGTKTIWLYTGKVVNPIKFDYKNALRSLLIRQVDVVVDGPYIAKLRDTSLAFRGSSNQRLIDIKKSKEKDQIVLWRNN